MNFENQDVPLFSRLHVSCSLDTTKESLQNIFSTFGEVENIKLIANRSTGQFMGTAFVKFKKASSAALALEDLSGKPVDSGAPLRVAIAHPKGMRIIDSPDPLEQPPRSRLFVTCPKEMAPEELEDFFSHFGHIEHVKLLVDRATNASRGLGYVKFSKASSAALAAETITQEAANSADPRPIRCRIADPRGSVPSIAYNMRYGYPRLPGYPLMEVSYQPLHAIGFHPNYPRVKKRPAGSNNTPPGSRLFISFSKPLPIELLQSIFMRYGPLESVYLVKGKNYGYAKYATAYAAQVALQSLNDKLVEGAACRVTLAHPQQPSSPPPPSAPPPP